MSMSEMATKELKQMENMETKEEKRLLHFKAKELISEVCHNLYLLYPQVVSMHSGEVLMKTTFRL